jgi:hypothetical protein
MSITLTRDQLYECVWETPIDTLRKEFGISNVGLGKICRHRQIPGPPPLHVLNQAPNTAVKGQEPPRDPS